MDKKENSALNKAEEIALGKDYFIKVRQNNLDDDYINNNVNARGLDKETSSKNSGTGSVINTTIDKQNNNGINVKNGQNGAKKRPRYGGFITAIVFLSVCVLALTGVIASLYTNKNLTENTLETSYKRAFYESVTYVDNIDLNMAKTMASKDTSAEQKYLNDVVVNAELCENALSELPLKDESRFYTVKLINQVSDYSKYLVNKLIDGDSISTPEWQNYNKLRDGILNLKEVLQKITDGGEDFSFKNIDKQDNILLENLNSLENLSSTYPELIYDGPFSDGRLKKTPKGVTGAEITVETAKNMAKDYFKDYGVKDLLDSGETSSQIPCYNFTINTDLGEVYAQISKVGGKLLLFTLNNQSNLDVDSDGPTQREYSKAIDFLSSVGIKNAKPVWSQTTGGYTTVNFVSVQDGVIIYPDMVKVKMTASSGIIVGYEAYGYYMNFTKRTLPKPVLGEVSARAKINTAFDVKSARLSVIPKTASVEELCYEFSALYQGDTYYIYISAITGKQVEMFKVVNGTEGELLM
jgi:germination protein YpeB